MGARAYFQLKVGRDEALDLCLGLTYGPLFGIWYIMGIYGFQWYVV